MLAIQTDFSIAIRLETLIAADVEWLDLQQVHGSLVLLEKFLNPDAFLVMQFTCLRLVLVQQQTVVGVKIIHLRYWYEKVLADVSHLAFYVAFLVTGIWIAETHPKTVVSMETLEEFGFMDVVAYTPAYARSVIKDQQTRYTFQILEDVLQALADAFCRLAAKYLNKTVVAVGEGHHEIFPVAGRTLHLEFSFTEIDLCCARFPDKFLRGFDCLCLAVPANIALDGRIGSCEICLFLQLVENTLGGMLLFVPVPLVLFQPLVNQRLIGI